MTVDEFLQAIFLQQAMCQEADERCGRYDCAVCIYEGVATRPPRGQMK